MSTNTNTNTNTKITKQFTFTAEEWDFLLGMLEMNITMQKEMRDDNLQADLLKEVERDERELEVLERYRDQWSNITKVE